MAGVGGSPMSRQELKVLFDKVSIAFRGCDIVSLYTLDRLFGFDSRYKTMELAAGGKHELMTWVQELGASYFNERGFMAAAGFYNAKQLQSWEESEFQKLEEQGTHEKV